MQAARAAYEANGKLDDIANNLVQKFAELEYSGNAEDMATLSFLKDKNFGSVTKAQFEALQGTVGSDGADSIELADLIGVEELTDEVAKQYGYETATKMVESFNRAFTQASEDIGDIAIENWSDKINNNLTLESSKTFKNLIKDM
jgi:hypothetical protein